MTDESIVLEGYRDISRVGSGGLGDVYRAIRVTTGGPVAIKVVREHADRVATDRRVRRELDALLKLKGHPNVVQVEELVEVDGGLALVMEFVTGGSLMDVLERDGAMPPAKAIAAGIDVARALQDAHALGIVHRDIKPHNVMIGSFGQCKVCDFGIAAMVKDSTFTDRTSALSYRYASPEEIADSDDVGPATDIYSLGITLRQLLTKETNEGRAIAAVNQQQALGRYTTAELRAIGAHVSLVSRMTHRSPEQRPAASTVFATLREMEFALAGGGAGEADDPDATVVRRTAVPSNEPVEDDATVIRPRSATPRPRLDEQVTAVPFTLPDPKDAPDNWWET